MNHPPAYYEDLASEAMRGERWLAAAQHWEDAAGASLGRGRRERYRTTATYCRLRAEGKSEDEANRLASR